MSRFPQLEDRGWLVQQSRARKTNEIAQMVGCSPSTVSRARRRFGLRFAPVLPDTEPVAGQPTIGEYITAGGPLRQSLLRTFDECPLQALWSTERHRDAHSGPSSLGTAFHIVAAEIVNTLRRTGETQIPSQEAVEIMYEVAARPVCPHLSVEQLAELRILTLQFCRVTWNPSRILQLEQRMHVEVPCPDGVLRTLTGSPDVIIAVPPAGCIVGDYKSGWAIPPAPRDGDFAKEGGRPYLSERGVFQLDTYGYMAMREYPQINWCTLREYHVRLGEIREARLDRADLEHVERRLGILLMRLERTLETRVAEPRPGSWCSHCPRPSQCPIAAEERLEGSITTQAEAVDVGRRLVVDEARRNQARTGLKAWYEDTDEPVTVGDIWIGWRFDKHGKRSFGVHNRPSAELLAEVVA